MKVGPLSTATESGPVGQHGRLVAALPGDGAEARCGVGRGRTHDSHHPTVGGPSLSVITRLRVRRRAVPQAGRGTRDDTPFTVLWTTSSRRAAGRHRPRVRRSGPAARLVAVVQLDRGGEHASGRWASASTLVQLPGRRTRRRCSPATCRSPPSSRTPAPRRCKIGSLVLCQASTWPCTSPASTRRARSSNTDFALLLPPSAAGDRLARPAVALRLPGHRGGRADQRQLGARRRRQHRRGDRPRRPLPGDVPAARDHVAETHVQVVAQGASVSNYCHLSPALDDRARPSTWT